MSDVLSEARGLIESRLAALADEQKRLEGALKELGGKVTKRRGPGKGAAAAAPASGGKKRRKRKGGASRMEQAIALVEKEPGISASDIAKKLKIKPNYLYRVMKEAEADGRVIKDGRSYKVGPIT